MKKIMVFIIVIAVLVIAGLAIFIATFDINRYRTAIAGKIGDAVGARVEMGKLSLKWQNGITVGFDGFKVLSKDNIAEHITARAESGSFSVEIAPLLRKEFRIGTVLLINPYLEIRREPDGEIVIAGMTQKKKEDQEGAPKTGGTVIPVFSIQSIELRNGTVEFTDLMKASPITLTVNKINVKIKNIALGVEGIPIEAEMAVFSPKQNVELKGSLNLSKEGAPASIVNGNAKIDIGATDIFQAAKAIPEIEQIGFKESPKGLLNVSVSKFSFAAPVKESEITVNYTDGRIVLAQLPVPLEKITVNADLKDDNVKINDISALFGGGDVSVKGNISSLSVEKKSDLAISLKNLMLSSILPKPGAGRPFVSGRTSFEFEGSAKGLTVKDIQNSLSGQGRLSVKDGFIVNMNVVRDVFQQLSMIPGLVETLESRLPDSYRAKLQSKDTALQPIEIPFTCQGGYLQFPELNLRTDYFDIVGKGEAGFDRSIGANVLLQINSDLSKAFMTSIKELQYLMNDSGQIEIPIKVKGYLTEVKVIPDLSYAAKRFAAAKAQEVVTDALSKMMKKDNNPGNGTADAQNPQTTGADSGSVLMDAIRKQISGK